MRAIDATVPHYDKLHANEIFACTRLALSPAQYLTVRNFVCNPNSKRKVTYVELVAKRFKAIHHDVLRVLHSWFGFAFLLHRVSLTD